MKIIIVGILFLTTLYATAQPTTSWQKSLGGTGTEFSNSIQQTTDGGYVLVGGSSSTDGDVTGNHGNSDFWVVKLTSLGVISWERSLGGTGFDEARSVQQTTDGGYIIVGHSSSSNGDVTGNHSSFFDCWVVKLTSLGVISWQKALGGTDSDYGTSVQQTTDGGYIVAGHSHSNNGDVTNNQGGSDFWVVKLTSLGVIDWEKSLGGTAFDEASSIQQTTDGGYIVAGYSSSNDGDVTGNHGTSDFWVVKLTNTGLIAWQKSLGGTGDESASSIQQTTDGGYIVAGYSSSNDGDVAGNYGGYSDCWIIKLTSTGVITWQKCLGGTGDEFASSIKQTTDGGYIVAGFSNSNDGNVSGNHGDRDFWVVKLSSLGVIAWQKSLGGTGVDQASSIQQTTNGGYIFAGHSSSTDGDVTGNQGASDCWVVKLAPTTTGIAKIIAPTIFSIFPNPTTKQLNIKADSKILGSNYTIQNNIGQIILSGKIKNVNTSIALKTLTSGIYTIQIQTLDGGASSRFVKK
jgi:hypothetical protein